MSPELLDVRNTCWELGIVMSISPIKRLLFGLRLSGLMLALLMAVATVRADVVTFEGLAFPEIEDDSWVPTPQCKPERWVEEGWLFQHVELGCWPPPGGDQDRYERSLADFIGEEEFFIEFRMFTDGESSEIPGVAPSSLVAGGFSVASYDFVISRDLVRFQRDAFVVTVFVEIEPGVAHTYRIELYGVDEYFIYIDGEVINSGVPGGPFPSHEKNVIAWRALAWFLPNTTQWDYVRLGTLPQNASGDFNTDLEVGPYDLYYFQECLSSEAGGWAGCAWADMDGSGDVDCTDWAMFVKAWSAPADAPCSLACGDCAPADFNGDGMVGPFDLATLLAAWGVCPEGPPCPADLNGDGSVGAGDLAILLASWG